MKRSLFAMFSAALFAVMIFAQPAAAAPLHSVTSVHDVKW
jgi:hypothetical protein